MTKPRYHMFLPTAGQDEKGKIIGAVLCTFGILNDRGYLIETGALDKWLADNPNATIAMLREHDSARILGQWTDIRIEGSELKADGQLYLDEIAEAAEARALIHADVLTGVSIGFDADPDNVSIMYDDDYRFRGLSFSKIELAEASLVFRPGDTTAGVPGVQSTGPAHTQSEGDDMTGITVDLIKETVAGAIAPVTASLKVVQDEADKKLDGLKEHFEQSIETKFGELDEGLIKTVNDAVKKTLAQSNAVVGDHWKEGTQSGRPAHLCSVALPQRFVQAANYASPTVGGGAQPRAADPHVRGK